MATTFGRLQEFHPELESIKSYLERVSLYFLANSIEENKQVPVLLSSIGHSTYSLLSDLLAPAAPGSKTYTEITAKLKDHFQPQKSKIAERFHFHKRDQTAGETVAEFDAALRRLAVNCTFGDAL